MISSFPSFKMTQEIFQIFSNLITSSSVSLKINSLLKIVFNIFIYFNARNDVFLNFSFSFSKTHTATTSCCPLFFRPRPRMTCYRQIPIHVFIRTYKKDSFFFMFILKCSMLCYYLIGEYTINEFIQR